MSPYTHPISELLTLGECHWREWSDYSQFEFTTSHIPELLQLAQDVTLLDHDDTDMVWGLIHAWRVLGILQAEAAVKPLIDLFDKEDEDFFISEYLPSALGRLGAPATPQLWAIACDVTGDEDVRDLAIDSLRWNASFHKEDLDDTINQFITLLDDVEDDTTYLNTALMCALIDLQAADSVKSIKRAFNRGTVDRAVYGDFEDIEVELGIKEKRTTIPDWRYDQDQEALLKQTLSTHSTMTLEQVEGFLFGIWESPQSVPPNRWMNAIFGDKPDLSEQLEKDIYRILLNLLDRLERNTAMGLPALPKSCCAETPDDEFFPRLQAWSRGFGEANSILVNFWEEIFQHPMMKDQEESWTACTIMLSVWSQPEQLLEKAKEPNVPNIEKMLSAVPSVTSELATICRGIKARWDAITEPKEPVTVVKIGRNDPCPCGSGKKYKKCCGA